MDYDIFYIQIYFHKHSNISCTTDYTLFEEDTGDLGLVAYGADLSSRRFLHTLII